MLRPEYWMTPRCVKAVSPSVSLSFNCRKITAVGKLRLQGIADLIMLSATEAELSQSSKGYQIFMVSIKNPNGPKLAKKRLSGPKELKRSTQKGKAKIPEE